MSTQQSAPLDGEYNGYKLTSVAILFIVLEAIFVALRFLARNVARTPWGLDDFLILPSLLFCWGIAILSLVMVYACGVGHHADYIMAIDPETYTSWAKSAVAVEIIYCTSVVFPKLSILAMYLRLFPVKKVYRYSIFVLMFIITTNGIAGIFTSGLSCRPLATRWKPELGGECINVTYYWRYISLANIISDVAMLILPLPVVWNLHVSLPQKLSLTILFLTGSFGLTSSIVRFAIFYDNEAFVDGTWASVRLMTWTLVEPGMYLIAACLPNYRPLWLHFRERLGSSKWPSHPHTSNTSASTKNPKYIELGEKNFANVVASKSSASSRNDLEEQRL
ncbi:MAG: hypothetical protein Q9188_006310 [Gyalolechia gomerana]